MCRSFGLRGPSEPLGDSQVARALKQLVNQDNSVFVD